MYINVHNIYIYIWIKKTHINGIDKASEKKRNICDFK